MNEQTSYNQLYSQDFGKFYSHQFFQLLSIYMQYTYLNTGILNKVRIYTYMCQGDTVSKELLCQYWNAGY